jgi:hypothetical protein
MIWIPFWAAGVINGAAHWWGYRNGQTRDHSRNIMPWGIIVGGEELHNNHHLDPARQQFCHLKHLYALKQSAHAQHLLNIWHRIVLQVQPPLLQFAFSFNLNQSFINIILYIL